MKTKVSPYVFAGLNDASKLRIQSDLSPLVTPEQILEIIGKNCNVTVSDILSRTRIREIVEARQMFCYVVREKFGYPLSRIGRMVNRDHATAIHSIKAHKDRCDVIKEYRNLTTKVFRDIDEFYSS